ncbi:MAG TPA: hypothetical protein VD758_11750 [Gemmatimonadaceae bacterium]|nr:hypothetical protein [Gemmatimonadaceae bacterium]
MLLDTLKSLRIIALSLTALVAFSSCSETSGPAVAVTLQLYSVDGNVVPVQLRTAGGKFVTIARGKLQGTNWGAACGVAVGLAEGPLTTVAIPACRLKPNEERTFPVTFTDARFPSGTHEFRFVPSD